jgi:hypothetical protein
MVGAVSLLNASMSSKEDLSISSDLNFFFINANGSDTSDNTSCQEDINDTAEEDDTVEEDEDEDEAKEKKEDEDRENAEFQRRKELEEEKMRQAARLMKKVPVLGSIGRRGISREEGSDGEEENAYVNPDEQASLGGGSNYEYEEEESFEGEDDEFGEGDGGHEDGEEEEYNPNAGWDGRRKEDLY